MKPPDLSGPEKILSCRRLHSFSFSIDFPAHFRYLSSVAFLSHDKACAYSTSAEGDVRFDGEWKKAGFPGWAFERTRFVRLKPDKQYPFAVTIALTTDKERSALYRLRIDYYDQSNPHETDTPFRDYSKAFMILE